MNDKQLTNEQVDSIESKLRDAQRLVEDAGAILSTVGGKNNSDAWGHLTFLADKIGNEIGKLYSLRPWEN